ncbi:MAG: hypothetical protein AB8B65_09015 [Kordia sp.]|uniref:hypothetical protein n=1 Tax=Kordia sp. TaxID=1965332 RepID=UPI00385F62F4
MNIFVSKNKPFSQAMFDTFPPSQYPLMLSVSFGKRETELRQQIKSVLQKQSSDDVKYRNKMYLSCSFECYFKDVDSMRPLLNQVLKNTELVIPLAMEKDKSVFPRYILKIADEVIHTENLNR